MNNESKQINYPYMPEGRDIKFTNEENPFMKRALEVRLQSKDKLFPVGTVAVKNGVVIGEAVNKPGYESKLLIDWHKKWMCFRRWFKAKTGTKYWLCPGCAGSNNHAENRLVKKMQKEGKVELINGADVYMAGHWWCCKPCWDKMIEAGIKDVYVVEGAKEKFDTRK